MHLLQYVISFRSYCSKVPKIMKYLNVAEKNDAAKNIAAFLSNGTARKREGLSRYNKIYEFDTNLFNQNVKMVMTSVSGHLLTYEFTMDFRKWNLCNPSALFDAPIIKSCSADYEPIKKTLEREIQSCAGLIIWTDCDREGENIGFEVIKVCREKKPGIRILRAKFSEITSASVFRALNNLTEPNQNISNAVDVRQEIDLRTGAAFTRLQTLHLSKVFPGKLTDKLISYGSCQFPTLGFVVDRYKDIESFIPEPFWKLKLAHTKNELTVEFTWDRDRLFSKTPCQSLLDICKENPLATVKEVISKPKNKWRPTPLDTVEMEKTVSKKLRINAKETMKIAERLYTQGYISYPRTETNIFPSSLNLGPLVELQKNDEAWGNFANRILNEGGPNPRQGKKSDQAHPPIHPTKYASNLSGNEKRLYEYIVRHFLACCHKDAVGHETIIKVNIADEKFTTKGLIILEKNYLDVYIYEKWNAKEIHQYQQGETFIPSVLEMAEGSTTAPKLLTEADLIALMEKCGIGTDATHADHIDTIKNREYVGLHDNIYFLPGTLGMGLVEGYDSIGLEVSLAKPFLRSEFEKDLKLICDGLKDPKVVLQEQIGKYRAMFENVVTKLNLLEEKIESRIEEQRTAVQNLPVLPTETFKPILKCPKCKNSMILKKRKENTGYFVSCVGFPGCKNAIWLPGFIETVEVIDEFCQKCGPDVKKLKIKFRSGQNPFFDENPKILCIGGCDVNVMETLTINMSSVMKINESAAQINQTNNNRNNSTNRQNNLTTMHQSSNDSGYNSWMQQNQELVYNTNLQNNLNQSSNNSRSSSRVPNVNTNEICCNCGENAIQLIVRKEGPNKGRKFYKCQKGKENGGCDYFLWAPNDNDNQQSFNTTVAPQLLSSTFNASVTTNIKCNCGQVAVRRTVQKEGPNKGRSFFTCPGSMQSRCNFFKWADDDGGNFSGNSLNGSFSGNNWRNNRGGNSRRGTKRKAPNNNSSRQKTKRKCGLCGEEGHIRTSCPNAN